MPEGSSMRKYSRLGITLLIAFFSLSCRGNAGPADSTANRNETAAIPDSAQGPSGDAEPASPKSLLPKLLGIYTMSEIESGGAVTIVPVSWATTFTFMEDGFYNRKSLRAGKEFSSGSGYYRVEKADDGTLTLLLDQKFMSHNSKSPPNQKRQTIELSPDGDLLRLTGTDGKIGIFRRTGFSQPKTFR